MRKFFIALIALAFAAPALANAKLGVPHTPSTAYEPLVFCTGGEGGFYEGLGNTVGKEITRKIGNQLEVLNTGGSLENATLMKDEECQIAIMQADAVTSLPLPSDIKVTDAHVEAVYWLHGKSGVSDFGELEESKHVKRYAVAIVSGSGADVTMSSFAKTDEDFKAVRRIEFEDWYSAAEAAAQGYTMKAGVRIEIAGLLYVGRPGFITSDITEDFGNALQIGEINDSSFDGARDVNGNPLYFKCAIDSKHTSGLKTSTFTSPDTYCMRAQIVYNNDYHKNLQPKEGRLVRRAVDKGINSVIKAVR